MIGESEKERGKEEEREFGRDEEGGVRVGILNSTSTKEYFNRGLKTFVCCFKMLPNSRKQRQNGNKVREESMNDGSKY